MTLTYKQIWEQYSQVQWYRKIYIKRLQQDGDYEADWYEVSHLLNKQGSVSRFSRSLPNGSYDFGKVLVGNANFQMMSPYQEFASERFPSSLFSGFIRHKSQIKVVDGFVDKYTDEENPVDVDVDVTVFTGLIDANTATTEQGYETFTALDFISTLDEVNVNELTLAQTTLNALVYEIMNRVEFTKFFNVDNSTTYINSGYNVSSIDVSQYDGTVLEMLEDLAKGHSIFFINPDDNYFYFLPATPTVSIQHEFLEENPRIIEISKMREGVDRQITHWYWKDTDISSIKVPAPVNAKPETLDIKGVTDNTQRQNLLNAVLAKTQDAKPYFQLEIPYFPVIRILDRITVQSFGQAPADAARWGFAKFGTDRYFQPAGIRISRNEEWMVRSVNHDKGLKTTLELEFIP